MLYKCIFVAYYCSMIYCLTTGYIISLSRLWILKLMNSFTSKKLRKQPR